MQATLGRTWRMAAACAFLVSALVLVLARPAAAELPVSPEVAPPNPGAVEEAIEASQQMRASQLARQEWLDGAEAQAEREQSRTAYADASAADAAALLRAKFATFFEVLNRPLFPSSDVEQYTGNTTALVDDDADGRAGGGSRVAVSTFPLRVPNEAGAKKPVSLSLEQGQDSFEPRNPLVEVSLPDQIGEGVDLPGTTEVSVTSAEHANASATPIGPQTVLYPEIDTDTDLVAAPIHDGVELSTLLRSPASPEDLTLQLDVPEGAQLQETELDGAVIIKDGKPLVLVRPPAAVDAQGSEVPLETSVVGHELRFTIPHQAGDWAYPILVDPAVTDQYQWWYGQNTGFADWKPFAGPGTDAGGNHYTPAFYAGNDCVFSIGCTGHRGLYIYSWFNQGYPAGSAGGFTYEVPGFADGRTTFVGAFATDWVMFNRENSPVNSPYLFSGIYQPGAHRWNAAWGTYSSPSPTYFTLYPDSPYGKYVYFMQFTPFDSYLWTHRVAYLGAAVVYLDDLENPTLNELQSSAGARAWRDREVGTVGLRATDPGLGVKDFLTAIPKRTQPPGAFEFAPIENLEQAGCTGQTGKLCRREASANLVYDTDNFREGSNHIWVTARDPLEHRDYLGLADTRALPVKVDRSAPVLDLSGSLQNETRPGNELVVNASDGSGHSPETQRSGVYTLTILVDDEEVFFRRSDCGESCPSTVSHTFTFNRAAYGTGFHQVRVVATDLLGHPTERTFRVLVHPSGPTDSWTYFPPDYDLAGSLVKEINGAPDADGTCQPPAIEAELGTADTLEVRELAVDPTICKFVTEEGVPPAAQVDRDEAEDNARAQDTESADDGGERPAPTPERPIHDTGAYLRSWYEDPARIDVVVARNWSQWSYNGDRVFDVKNGRRLSQYEPSGWSKEFSNWIHGRDHGGTRTYSSSFVHWHNGSFPGCGFRDVDVYFDRNEIFGFANGGIKERFLARIKGASGPVCINALSFHARVRRTRHPQ